MEFCQLIVIFIGVIAFHGLGGSDAADVLCKDITNDLCDEGIIVVFDTIPDVPDMDTCQIWCNEVIGAECDFVIWDKKQEKCLIIKGDYQTYEDSCKRVTSPLLENNELETCLNSTDPCTKFVYEEVSVNGEQGTEVVGASVPGCNTGCKITTGCEFFAFDFSDVPSSCLIYGSGIEIVSEKMRGPKTPYFSTCYQAP